MEDQKVLKMLGTQTPAQGEKRAFERTEQTGVIYEMLIGKGYLDEEKLSYAKRVHSKLRETRLSPRFCRS